MSVKFYICILFTGVQSAPTSWPSHGYIQLTDVHARYASHLDPVLCGLNVEIKAGEKVGYCLVLYTHISNMFGNLHGMLLGPVLAIS